MDFTIRIESVFDIGVYLERVIQGVLKESIVLLLHRYKLYKITIKVVISSVL